RTDRDSLLSLRKSATLVRRQAEELQAFWKTGDANRGKSYERIRQEAWKNIRELLGPTIASTAAITVEKSADAKRGSVPEPEAPIESTRIQDISYFVRGKQLVYNLTSESDLRRQLLNSPEIEIDTKTRAALAAATPPFSEKRN